MSCELPSFLEANREAIKAEIIKILLQQMLLAAKRIELQCLTPETWVIFCLEELTPEQKRTRSMPGKFKVYQIPKVQTKL